MESAPSDPGISTSFWGDYFEYFWNFSQGDLNEGGAVSIGEYRVLEDFHLTNRAGSKLLFAEDGTTTALSATRHFDLSSNLDWTSHSWGSSVDELVPAMSGTDAFFSGSGVFVADSGIIPIPPPVAEPGGGDEGGHIAMTPFIAPLLGLPGAGQSQLAAETRQSLNAEQLESAPTGGAHHDSLRGRAVVYEVAYAEPLGADVTSVASTRAKLNRMTDGSAAASDFAFIADHARPDGAGATAHAGMSDASLAATGVRSARTTPAGDHAAVEVERRERPIASDVVLASADLDTDVRADDAAVAAAHDAAIEELEDGFEPLIGEQREVAAATVDMNGKRVLGGALIAVAAIPVAKVARRRGQRPIEARPRRVTI